MSLDLDFSTPPKSTSSSSRTTPRNDGQQRTTRTTSSPNSEYSDNNFRRPNTGNGSGTSGSTSSTDEGGSFQENRGNSGPGGTPRYGSKDSRDQRRMALRGSRKDSTGRRRSSSKFQRRKEEEAEFDSQVIDVRRVTRVVKGGKRMRFSALVVVGDRNGQVGIGLRKGADYQDAVNKATRKAKNTIISVSINEEGSIDFPSYTKHKSCEIFVKPAKSGTGVIAGGFFRPVLELAGIRNVYSKITRSRNKVAGTQAAFAVLKKYPKLTVSSQSQLAPVTNSTNI